MLVDGHAAPHTLRVTVQRKFGGFFHSRKPVTLAGDAFRITETTDQHGVAAFRFIPPGTPLWLEVDGRRLDASIHLSWQAETRLRVLI